MIDYQDIYVITAPSGTGKTTINRRLIEEVKNIEISISHTTRKQRPGEVHGDHYWFIGTGEFENLIKENKMIEWAKVFGNYYGTSFFELDRISKKEHKILLEIDVQGWLSVKAKISKIHSVFILPPSMEVLWKRLKKRGTDSFSDRLTRFNKAKDELKYSSSFANFIINDDFEETFITVKNFVTGKQNVLMNYDKAYLHIKKLLDEFTLLTKKDNLDKM